jgi:prepilin peptidase CpaA
MLMATISNELQVLGALSALCLIAVLLIAMVCDLLTHRIPNILLGPALLAAVILSVAGSGISGGLLSLAGLCIGVAMLLPLYALGAMGAGDAKLLGVVGAFLGPWGALVAGLATLIVGAVIGGLYIVWHGHDRRAGTSSKETSAVLPFNFRVDWLTRVTVWLQSLIVTTNSPGAVASRESDRKNSTFAYAPAIAVGSLFALWQQTVNIAPILGN